MVSEREQIEVLSNLQGKFPRRELVKMLMWLAAGIVWGVITWSIAVFVGGRVQGIYTSVYYQTDAPYHIHHLIVGVVGSLGGVLTALVMGCGPMAFPDKWFTERTKGIGRIGTALAYVFFLSLAGFIAGISYVIFVFSTTKVSGWGGLIIGLPFGLAWGAVQFGIGFYGAACVFSPSALVGRQRLDLWGRFPPILLVLAVLAYYGVTTFNGFRSVEAMKLDPNVHGTVVGLWFTPDSKRLVSAGGEIKIWDLDAKILQQVIQWDPNSKTILFSSDSKLLAIYSTDYVNNAHGIEVWDLEQKVKIRDLRLPGGSTLNMIGFGHDQATFVTLHKDEGLQVWDLSKGVVISSIPVVKYKWVKVEPSKKGQYLSFVAQDRFTLKAYIWDSAGGRLLSPDLGNDVWYVKFLDQDQILGVASGEGVRLFRTADWSRLDRTSEEEQMFLRWEVDLSPGGQARRARDEIKQRWPVVEKYGSVSITPDRTQLFFSSDDGAMGWFNITTGTVTQLCGARCFQDKPVQAAATSPDNQWLAIAYAGRVSLWHLPSKQRAEPLREK